MTKTTQTIRMQMKDRGAAAILAMMFLVIFGSLAAAMAIVSQGNLASADSQMKINRSQSAAETGMKFVIHRLEQVARATETTYGLIDPTRADELWMDNDDGVRQQLYESFSGEFHNIAEPQLTSRGLGIGPISVGPGQPTFTATFEPHPLPGPGGAGDFSRYDDPFYDRAPYNDPDQMGGAAVSSTNPMDARWVRVVVTAFDGPDGRTVARSISMDFRIDKKLRFAILSRSRVMIGRNVMIEGQIGSKFMEVNLEHGHPVQMANDFRLLNADLDANLDLLLNTLITNDINGDNRLDIGNPSEIAGIPDPGALDADQDGFITDFDFFIMEFDANADGSVSATELDTASDPNRRQLLELIDTFGDPARPGYDDGFINGLDRFAKISGQVKISAAMADWNDGAAGGAYQDYFQGAIRPEHNEAPLTFESSDNDVFSFDPDDFDVDSFKTIAGGDLATQATTQADTNPTSDPTGPVMDLSGAVFEEVPFGSAYPYDHYERPLYRNMTFTNITIPAGTNALFENCTFIGVTFVETTTANTDNNFNFAGMQEDDGSLRFPDMSVATTDPNTGTSVTVSSTKDVSNNVRFHNCQFEGTIVTRAANAFTHVRNKLNFTGKTKFILDESVYLTESEKDLFRRSTILAPHYSLEMGTFISPLDNNETVNLSGTIIAGLVDMRGQVKINGSLITTFEPVSNVAPVIGDTSPQFNTTLGYFPVDEGDLEAELPANGVGVIHVRYDPTIPMPDGITGPIEIAPMAQTYFEGVAP